MNKTDRFFHKLLIVFCIIIMALSFFALVWLALFTQATLTAGLLYSAMFIGSARIYTTLINEQREENNNK